MTDVKRRRGFGLFFGFNVPTQYLVDFEHQRAGVDMAAFGGDLSVDGADDVFFAVVGRGNFVRFQITAETQNLLCVSGECFSQGFFSAHKISRFF